VARVIRAKPVSRDLDRIFSDVCGNNGVEVASAQLNRIESVFHRLGAFPGLGRDWSDLRPGLRTLSEKPWQVLYRLNGEDVVILRVLDGRMNIAAIFGKKT
jgi:toxin ParE1/3/4